MTQLIPVLTCAGGLGDGEFFVLGDRADVVIGRSRTCDISFQRFRKFLALPEMERKQRDDFNSAVSRRHLRIIISGSKVTAENLSSAGSFCNEVRFDSTREHDLKDGPLQLRLGQAEEKFKISLLTPEQVEALVAPTQMPMGRGRGEPRTDNLPLPFAEDPTPAANPALTPSPRGDGSRAAPMAPRGGSPAGGPSITFAGPGGRKSLPFTPGDEMLAFLEGANAPCADRGCGVGSCHTCKLKVLKGREHVTMITDYDDSGLEKNEILPCCSSVKGPVEVEKG